MFNALNAFINTLLKITAFPDSDCSMISKLTLPILVISFGSSQHSGAKFCIIYSFPCNKLHQNLVLYIYFLTVNQLSCSAYLIASGSRNLSIWIVVSSESSTVRIGILFQAHLCSYLQITVLCHMNLHKTTFQRGSWFLPG